MPRHFANLTGAATLPTSGLRLTRRIVVDLVENIGNHRRQNVPNGHLRETCAA